MSVSESNLGIITRLTLKERQRWTSAIPESIHILNHEAHRKHFLQNAILRVYKQPEGQKLPFALKSVQFIALGLKKGTQDTKYYLLLKRACKGVGFSRIVYQGITPKGAFCAIATLKEPAAITCVSEQERQAYLALKECPNILRLKRSEGRYAIFELAAGNLEQHLASPLTSHSSEHILRGCLEGIVQMTEKQILHLDLKPDNILIDLKGTVKIADLEMTAQLDEQGHFKSGNLFQGNVLYCSPERRALTCHIVLNEETESYGPVDSKDSTWAAMQLLCYVAIRLPNHRLLSAPFCNRFSLYAHELWTRHETALERAKAVSLEERVHFYCLYFHQEVLSHLASLKEKKGMFCNLFQYLVPETPLDKVVFPMAYLSSQKRSTPLQALNRFNQHFS